MQRWLKKTKSPDHRLPRKLAVYVSPAVAASDDGGAVGALVDAVDDELRARGYESRLIGARPDERPPVPRLEIQVLSASVGDRRMRGAGNLASYFWVAGPALTVAASGSVLVDCYVVQGNPLRVTFQGRISASNLFGETAGHDTASAEAAGRSIAAEVSES